MSTAEPAERAPERADAPPTDRRRPLTLGAGLFAFFLSALWGGQPVSLKAGLADAPPLRIGWMRFALGIAVVLLWAVAARQSFRLKRGEVIPLTLLGALFAVQLAFMNIGQNLTTAGHAGVVIPTFPLWAALFAHLIIPADSMSRRRAAGALIAYSGVVIVFLRNLIGDQDYADAPNPLLGDGLLLCSAALLGLRQVYISQLGQSTTQVKILMAQGIFGTVSFLLASLLLESEPMRVTWVLAASLLYQGVVIAGFGFISQTWLLSRYLPSRVSIISLSQPIVTVMLSWLILGEQVGAELVAGAALVIAGSYFAQRSNSDARQPRQSRAREAQD